MSHVAPLANPPLHPTRRVWRGAFGNLLSGKDPRKPFVDAFADEQLLGFFKYYKIILEHSKTNIAGGGGGQGDALAAVTDIMQGGAMVAQLAAVGSYHAMLNRHCHSMVLAMATAIIARTAQPHMCRTASLASMVHWS